MESVVICNPVRTAIGGFKGVFTPLQAPQIATQALECLLQRTGLGPGQVDDVILGQCYPNGESPAIGRIAALDAGLGIETGGWQLDRRCGSGLQSVLNAVMQVTSGVDTTVIAGGAESMTNAEFYALGLRQGVTGEKLELVDRLMRGRVTAGGHTYPVAGGMIETAENLRAEYTIPREEQDEFAYHSQMKAKAAIESGKFDEEIVPITLPATRKTPEQIITADEHPRPGTTLESLGKLSALRAKNDPDSTVTAGNSSGQNDAASMCVVTTEANAAELGLTPMVRLVGWTHAGVPPKTMGIGPVPAVAKLFARTGLSMADMDLIELNEAFAAQAMACLREWDVDWRDERLNVNGSGISLGHPVGATGCRILTTMAYEMQRRGSKYGLETMCIGGGQGLAAIFENISG